MDRAEYIKYRIRMALKLNVFQFVKYNFFSKKVHRAKGAYIFPFWPGKIELWKGAEIYLNGNLILNKPEGYRVLPSSNLYMEERSKLIINGQGAYISSASIVLVGGVLEFAGANKVGSGSHIFCRNRISFGEGSGMSYHTVVRDTTGHPSGTNPDHLTASSAPVIIGKHVWIGENAFVCRGTEIGDGAIIGGNATVSGTIPPRTMVAPSIDKVVLSDVYWFYSEETKEAELKKYYDGVKPASKDREATAPKEIFDKVCSVFSALGYDGDIMKGEDLIGSKGIDSLSLLSLIAELEEQFSVKIPISEINGRSFYSVETIAALMDKLAKNSRPATQTKAAETSAQERKPLELHIEDTEKPVVQRIFENSIKTPDKVAVITENTQTTYSELCKLIYSYSETYRQLSIKAGDHVVLQAIRDVRYIAAFYACHLLSAVPVPVENEIGKERVIEIAGETNAQLIICNSMDCGEKYISYEELDNKTNIVTDIPLFSLRFPELNEPSQILFTTGTTGKSKGVVHSHRNMSNVAYGFAKATGLKQGDVRGNPFPINHGGSNLDMYTVLANGQTFVFIPGWTDLNQVMRIIVENKVTSVFCPAAALRMLLMIADDDESGIIKKQLDYVVITSSAASKNTINEFLQKFLCTELIDMYGTTECMLISFLMCRMNSHVVVGSLFENADIRLCRQDNNTDTDEKTGRISVKSPCTMMGYYKDNEQTSKAFDNDYIVLADFGYFDENGALHFAGRADDVINVGGYKISPIEIEAVADESGLVQECILIKSFDKHNNEYLELLVVPKEPGFSAEALMNFIKDKVEAYRVPKKITVVDELKKTYNGKLDRKAYRS